MSSFFLYCQSNSSQILLNEHKNYTTKYSSCKVRRSLVNILQRMSHFCAVNKHFSLFHDFREKLPTFGLLSPLPIDRVLLRSNVISFHADDFLRDCVVRILRECLNACSHCRCVNEMERFLSHFFALLKTMQNEKRRKAINEWWSWASDWMQEKFIASNASTKLQTY